MTALWRCRCTSLSLRVIATVVAEFLTELEPSQVTVVGHDWSGAQRAISSGRTDRVANLEFISCDAFENYPPALVGRLLCATAALLGGTFLTAQMLRPR